MKQSSLGLGTSTKRTRRREFLDVMDRVVPWPDLVADIQKHKLAEHILATVNLLALADLRMVRRHLSGSVA